MPTSSLSCPLCVPAESSFLSAARPWDCCPCTSHWEEKGARCKWDINGWWIWKIANWYVHSIKMSFSLKDSPGRAWALNSGPWAVNEESISEFHPCFPGLPWSHIIFKLLWWERACKVRLNKQGGGNGGVCVLSHLFWGWHHQAPHNFFICLLQSDSFGQVCLFKVSY